MGESIPSALPWAIVDHPLGLFQADSDQQLAISKALAPGKTATDQ